MKTEQYPINGYYAKLKTGKTLYQFEWSPTDQLFLILDDGSKQEVDPFEYEIVQMEHITADNC